MKVLLLNVMYEDDMPTVFHLPLAFPFLKGYIEKALKDVAVDIKTILVNADLQKQIHLIDFPQYSLVGFQPSYNTIENILDISNIIKEKSPTTSTVLGGVYASAIGKEILSHHHFIDFIVIGEGEISLVKLIEYLRKRSTSHDVEGILFRSDNNEFVYNPRGDNLVDLNNLSLARHDYLAQFPPNAFSSNSIRIESARGCLGSCSFCSNSYKYRLERYAKRWRGMSPERLVDEIKYLYNHYGARIFNFTDPSFEDPGKRGKERIQKIARELINQDIRISYKVNLRCETFTPHDLDLLQLLRKSGMNVAIIGIESANTNELSLLCKRSTNEQGVSMLNLLNQAGVFVLVGFIMFTPYSTLESLKKNLDFLSQIGRLWDFNCITNTILVFRGTNLYNQLLSESLIDNPDDYLGLPRFTFLDERVQKICNAFQDLKIACPELYGLYKTLCSSHNLIVRFENRMNAHLWNYIHFLEHYREKILAIQETVGKVHWQLFNHALATCENGKFNEEQFKTFAYALIYPHVTQLTDTLRTHTASLIRELESCNLDCSTLKWKAWVSHMYEKANLAGK